jgi:uncharacterized phage protein (TIGR02220 family)
MNHGREDQNIWTKWYWQDWESDTGLRACSLAAQGLWQRMLSVMARAKRKGFLLDGEKQMESKTLAKIVGESVEMVDTLIVELFDHGVPSRDKDGIIYNRRMARDSSLSEIRSRCGRLKGKSKSKTEAKAKQNKSKVILKEEAKGEGPSASASVYASVIEFLNLKTKKNFSLKSESSKRHINARIFEGRTLEDFKHVIEVKARAWKDDPKMNAYLRPETLFGSKMEAYLNEYIILTPQEKERMVGAGSEKTPEQKAKAAEEKKKIEAAAKRIFEEKYGPRLEELQKNADVDGYRKLRRVADDEYRIESGKIMRGEV